MSIRKDYKKKGFTLIEVIAALAIISILSLVLAPKVTTYIQQSNKTRSLEEVREVILAVEDYNISSGNKISEDESYLSIKSKIKTDVVDFSAIKSIGDAMTYRTMENIANGKQNFELQDGYIKIN